MYVLLSHILDPHFPTHWVVSYMNHNEKTMVGLNERQDISIIITQLSSGISITTNERSQIILFMISLAFYRIDLTLNYGNYIALPKKMLVDLGNILARIIYFL